MTDKKNALLYHGIEMEKSFLFGQMYEGTGDNVVNGKPLAEFFPVIRNQQEALAPLTVLEKSKGYYFTAKTVGGGITGQSGAIKMGLSRALVIADESYKPTLN